MTAASCCGRCCRSAAPADTPRGALVCLPWTKAAPETLTSEPLQSPKRAISVAPPSVLQPSRPQRIIGLRFLQGVGGAPETPTVRGMMTDNSNLALSHRGRRDVPLVTLIEYKVDRRGRRVGREDQPGVLAHPGVLPAQLHEEPAQARRARKTARASAPAAFPYHSISPHRLPGACAGAEPVVAVGFD
jgi:hypothetical protein